MKNLAFACFALATACSLLLVGTGCGKSDKASNGAFVLRVGFDADFPPYGFRDNDGNLVGFDLDLAKEVAERRGWNIELKPIDWDSKDAELNAGTINCIWNGFTINGREELYTWSEPYVNNSQVILVKSAGGITKLADLAGRVVEVQADSSGQAAVDDESNAALKASFKKLISVPNYNQAFMELETGICDAIVIDEGVAMSYVKAHGQQYRVLAEDLKAEEYGVGFKLGNTDLRDQVQETLDEMIADGTFRTISEKWFDGKDVTIQK